MDLTWRLFPASQPKVRAQDRVPSMNMNTSKRRKQNKTKQNKEKVKGDIIHRQDTPFYGT